ncbi:hypothetical protein LCY76_07095 [Fictibacillus sp. KIGAM418]|uniref:Uncharacterized protein n=1 Tax=Fictibacillus marinisediminis TaxID=2878389 RepID=A0A9X2BD66_9BACL|nr:hypothetical protein [Fictibacillus marinisediminis]MCK6256360.1 hypothetical protein [Fictibacillus marinisediminis]
MRKLVTALITLSVLFGAGLTYYNVSASGTYDDLPKEKKEIMERKAIDKEKARKDNISKKDGVNGPLVVQHDRAVTAQILSHVEDPVNDQTTNFTNGWVSPIKDNEMKGKNVTVEAGSGKKDSLQGMMIVKTEDNNRKFIQEKKYKTPSKHGPVKITAVDGFDLTLQAEDGKKWVFNVPTGAFKDL